MDQDAPATIIGVDDDLDFGSTKPETGKPEPNGTDKSVNGISTIDPFKLEHPTTTGERNRNPIDPTTGKRRRGRPAGSGSAKSTDPSKAVSQDITLDLEGAIFGLHEMLAGFLHIQELELDREEAAQGAKHVQSISKLYNKQLNPATLVWCAFLMWCLTVYGTRSVAIYKRFTEPKSGDKKGPQLVKPETAPTAQPANITNPSELWNEAPIDG